MGYEFELKYTASPQALAAANAKLADRWQTIAMETTYYDDPQHRLRKLHYTLRRRLENGASICTLKTPMPDGGRGEWEVACPSIEAAIEELCKLGAPQELRTLTQEGVMPTCGARFTRRAAAVRHNGTVLEIALDEGILFGGSREESLCELEVELKEGRKEDAIAFTQAIAATYGLTPQPKSKVSRAMALAEDALCAGKEQPSS